MLIIISIISIILLIYSFFHIIRYFIFIKNIKKKDNNNHNEKIKYIIVIPCLNEQNTIVETVDYFKHIVPEYIPIVLVT